MNSVTPDDVQLSVAMPSSIGAVEACPGTAARSGFSTGSSWILSTSLLACRPRGRGCTVPLAEDLHLLVDLKRARLGHLEAEEQEVLDLAQQPARAPGRSWTCRRRVSGSRTSSGSLSLAAETTPPRRGPTPRPSGSRTPGARPSMVCGAPSRPPWPPRARGWRGSSAMELAPSDFSMRAGEAAVHHDSAPAIGGAVERDLGGSSREEEEQLLDDLQVETVHDWTSATYFFSSSSCRIGRSRRPSNESNSLKRAVHGRAVVERRARPPRRGGARAP